MNYMQLGTYHQFHVRDKYLDAVTECGGLPLPIPCMEEESITKQYLSMIDALVIIGGLDYPPDLYGQEPHPTLDPAHPRRFNSDLILYHRAKEAGLPILGICAGLQLINIANGGQLIQHIDTVENHMGEVYHPVQVVAGKWLPQIFGDYPIVGNSNHHQAIDPRFIGKDLICSGYAEDGIIEAIEHTGDQFIVGVQWHPERNTDEHHRTSVFNFLIKQAILYRTQK